MKTIGIELENSYPLERAVICRSCKKKLWRMPYATLELPPISGSHDVAIMEYLDSHIGCCESPNWNWL